MKTFKIFSLALGLFLIGCLSGCQKDKAGVYQPKKKIQQIFYSYPDMNKSPYQIWEWSGDQLSTVTHYPDPFFKSNWMELFTYENGRISRVDNLSNKEYITYDYADDQLKSATLFYHNSIISSWTASYDNGKLSKLTGTIYDGFKKDHAQLTLDPLAGLLPKEVGQQVTQRQQQQAMRSNSDEPMTFLLLLTWNDNHIEKLICVGDGESMTFKMQYDDKICPFYGFMGGLEDYYFNFTTGHTGFTKNNVTRIILTEDQYVDTICYAYQYDADKYPILQTMYYTDDPDDKMVLYYEY